LYLISACFSIVIIYSTDDEALKAVLEQAKLEPESKEEST
jgi:hypothetical protein